jgi:hypothetical protein
VLIKPSFLYCLRNNNAGVLRRKKASLSQPKHWLSNIVAGVIVGVVALPLAMVFAIASGAKPEQGIYTAIVAGFIVSIFGGSRLQISGPTGAFIVVLSAITAKYGIERLKIASLMAGVIHFLRRMAGNVEVRQATEQQLKPGVTQKELVKLRPDVLVLRLKSRYFSVRLEILSAPWRKHISILDI